MADDLVMPPSPSYIKDPPAPDPDQRQLTPLGLYSHAADVVNRMPQMKGTPAQFKAMLLKQGVKPDELKWSKYDETFADRPGANQPRVVTKQELKRHFEKNLPRLQETWNTPEGDDDFESGTTQYHTETLPGGKNYREGLLHLPLAMRATPNTSAWSEVRHNVHSANPKWYRVNMRGIWDTTPFDTKAQAEAALGPPSSIMTPDPFNNHKKNHWDGTPNVVAHLRLSDRKDAQKRKILHLEELQSDWAQQGRKEGFKRDLTPEEIEERNGIIRQTMNGQRLTPEQKARDLQLEQIKNAPPIAPYVDSTQKWVDLGLKRALHEAAKGGYDRLVVTPGEEQAKRYDLSKHIGKVEYRREPGSKRILWTAHSPTGEKITPWQTHNAEELSQQLGHELAAKMLTAEEGKEHTLSGLDLQTGGEGMKTFYDRLLPQALEKLARKHDPEARVQLNGAHLPAGKYKGYARYEVGPGPVAEHAVHGVRANGSRILLEQNHRTRESAERRAAELESAARKGTAVHSLDITPRMRESILKGQPAYAAGGAVSTDIHASEEGEDHPAWIPTRLVTSKKGQSERHHIVDMPSFKETPELFEKNVDLLRAYPNMRLTHAGKDHDVVAKEMIRHIKDNLLDLHDRVPEEIRNRSKRWYDGARAITNDWMQKYNLPDHSVAGALAALSPQKDWYQNVSLAKRVLDTLRGGGDNFYKGQTFDDAMEKTWRNRPSLAKPEYEGLVNMLRGKSLHDIDQMGLPAAERAHAKAMWVRMHDETYNDASHPIITPEGGTGDLVKTDKGENAKVGWGSLGEIAKAVRAVESAHDPAALSPLMGERHKVRNFYNNILSPNSKHGDVTMDTHAIAAGLMRPLSGNSLEVSHNFANYPGKDLPTAGGSAISGVQGTYPIFADAYRQAAKARGVKPREMQSITWEAIRGLFPDTFKTKSNNAKIDAVWDLYRKGKVSQARARDIIHGIAGGIRPPTWFAGADEANGSAADPAALPGSGVHGQAAPGAVPGAGSGAAGRVSAQGLTGAKLQKAAGGSVDHHPSEAQKAAGNYAKEHISFQGIPIAIENKLGSVRSGRDARGRPWSCKLPADYGYIKRTEGADGDHVDCYVGPAQDSQLVVVVNQRGPDRKFDEHKCLLGFKSERDALDCYVKAFFDGKGADRIGAVEVMSLDGFKKWLSSGKTKRPLSTGSIVDQALRMVAGASR